MLWQVINNSLQAPARPHVLRIVELHPSGVVLMEGSDAARCVEQCKNVAHCPLPILDTRLYPERNYRGPTVHCRECGLRTGGAKMVLCVACQEGYHIWCLDVPLVKVSDEPWHCPKHEGTHPNLLL